MSTFRTGNHWGVTIVREGEPARLFGADAHGAGGRGRFPDNCGWPGEQCIGHAAANHAADELVAVVVNGDQALAEKICALLNADEQVAAQCQEETWSWQHFNSEQADGYWITCDRTGPHDEHKDEHTGLTWRTEVS